MERGMAEVVRPAEDLHTDKPAVQPTAGASRRVGIEWMRSG